MALEAGCHVFTEKPLAENTDQCKELVDLAKLKGKALVVGYILRQHRVDQICRSRQNFG